MTYSLGVYSPITTLSAVFDEHTCFDRISVIGHCTPMNAFGLRIDSAKYSVARKWLHASALNTNKLSLFRNFRFVGDERAGEALTQSHHIFDVASGLRANAVIRIEIHVTSVHQKENGVSANEYSFHFRLLTWPIFRPVLPRWCAWYPQKKRLWFELHRMTI